MSPSGSHSFTLRVLKLPAAARGLRCRHFMHWVAPSVKLEQLSNGVAQQNLSPVLAAQMEFARPPRELRLKFATLAEPMVKGIVQLYSKIQNLRRTRDQLLPRLLSGQVELETN